MDLAQTLQILGVSALVFAHILLIALIVLAFSVVSFLGSIKKKTSDTMDAVQGAAFSLYNAVDRTRKNVVFSVIDAFLGISGRRR
jgi:cell shape-determining protein MreC